MSDTDDIEDIRERKRRELREQAQTKDTSDQSPPNSDSVDREAILKQILTDDARRRLNAVRMTHPDRVDYLETQLLRAAAQGRLPDQVNDDQITAMLEQLNDADSTTYTIRRR